MILSLIVAASDNHIIGRKGALPWKLPHDLRYFRDKTSGHPIIMGRKTFDAIGKPLAGRTSIVLTRDTSFHPPHGVIVVHSLLDAIATAKQLDREEAFVIGGGQVYAQALPFSQRVYLTQVHTFVDGDTFFPPLEGLSWKLVSAQRHEADDAHCCPYTFCIYERQLYA